MRALRDSGFRVPEPLAHNRHTIVMELIDAFPLRQIKEVPDPSGLYAELIEMILQLASVGLIHGDFNEFNILIKEEEPSAEFKGPSDAGTEEKQSRHTLMLKPYLIDFPQMVSIDHANSEMYFDRDVNCIKSFFERRFHFTSDEPGPFLGDAKKRAEDNLANRVDIESEASGFSKKMAKELEKYMQEVGVDGDQGAQRGVADDDDSDTLESEDEQNYDNFYEDKNVAGI